MIRNAFDIMKLGLYGILLFSVIFLFTAVKEYYYIPKSEKIKGVVIDKSCNLRYKQKLYVSYRNSDYVVIVANKDCLDVVVNDYLELYYSSELDKIFLNKERSPILIIIGVLVSAFSFLIIKK